MASLSEEERALMEQDREANPECFYSTSLSQSCKSVNGDSKCEVIRKIFRQCPGKRKEVISNQKEVTEDEHGGAFEEGDFFNREKMDGGQWDGFGMNSFFRSNQQGEDEVEAQMNPFEFFRQEMLRPFEKLFGEGMFGGDDSSFFEGLEKELGRMDKQPPSFFDQPNERPARRPQAPPHYNYQPHQGEKSDKARAHADEKKDMFAGYDGKVDEI